MKKGYTQCFQLENPALAVFQVCTAPLTRGARRAGAAGDQVSGPELGVTGGVAGVWLWRSHPGQRGPRGGKVLGSYYQRIIRTRGSFGSL